MKLALCSFLACQRCSGEIRPNGTSDNDPIANGTLQCQGCGAVTLVKGGIPRFVESHYSESFGFQWNQFNRTQLDSYWQLPISRARFFEETGWAQDLRSAAILEVGSGSGRFTQIAADTGARVISLDASNAVDAAAENNSDRANVDFIQASVYELPLKKAAFDRIFCFGVLQHCPDPRGAFMAMVPLLKPGGEIVIDVYRKDWKVLFLGKYYLRPITRRVAPERLLPFVRRYVGLVYPFTGFLRRIVGRHARKLSWALAVADYRGVYDLAPDRQRELSLLDTYDMLAPAYDRPQTIRKVRLWFAEARLESVDVRPGYNGIQARGRRPLNAQ